jgi:hypothetical protein
MIIIYNYLCVLVSVLDKIRWKFDICRNESWLHTPTPTQKSSTSPNMGEVSAAYFVITSLRCWPGGLSISCLLPTCLHPCLPLGDLMGTIVFSHLVHCHHLIPRCCQTNPYSILLCSSCFAGGLQRHSISSTWQTNLTNYNAPEERHVWKQRAFKFGKQGLELLQQYMERVFQNI